jgi:hypothetical protein
MALAREQDADPDEGDGGQRQQLYLLDLRAQVGLRRDLEVALERAQHHLQELRADRERVGGDHERPFGARAQPAVGKGEIDVEEDGDRQQVEERSERRDRQVVGELQRGEPDREPSGDHQRAEAAVGAA